MTKKAASGGSAPSKSKGKVEEEFINNGTDLFGPHVPSSITGQEVVNCLATTGVPPDYSTIIPGNQQSPESAPEGFICLHAAYFTKAGLGFPFPDLLLEVLDRYQLSISQLAPSGIRSIMAFVVRGREEGFRVTIDEFVDLFQIKESPSQPKVKGFYYLSSRTTRGFLRNEGVSDEKWKAKYFFLKVEPWVCSSRYQLRNRWGTADG